MSVERGRSRYGSRTNELDVRTWSYDGEAVGARGEPIRMQGSVRASNEAEAKKLALEKIMSSGARSAAISQIARGER